jgi:hypothetical protein
MGFELLLVAAFYLVARTQFGWWLPAESLTDPNILSAWRPALGPISQALMAGTWEEAMFRAVPLAGAALIGQRLGWRRSCIAVALVLQALVFAGGHANYPGLPSYSRVVELFFPALVWGLIFLRFGLVPCIVMHFTFDLTLMSLPLFVASDPRLWLDRALVLLAGLVPLLMLARARFKQGYFAELPAALRHGLPADIPPGAEPTQSVEAIEPSSASAATASAQSPWWLRRTPLALAAALGALALLLWPTPEVFTSPFTVDHAGAISRAEGLLAASGVRLDADWKRLAIVRPEAAGDANAIRFVWREAGPQVFAKLLGGTLLPQHWQVQFMHVSGPVEERAEVWEVALTGQGEVLALEHHLPEGRAGAKLDREQAQALVKAYMADNAALAQRPWELASVQQFEHPARRDWTFFWDDKQALDLKGGTSRVAITVRGDELAAWQYVFVPEAWVREQLHAESAKTPFKIAAGLAGAVLVLLALGVTLRQVVQGTLRWRLGLTWGALFFVASMTEYVLTLDSKAMAFNVAQDWNMQLATSLALAAAGYLLAAALIGLLSMRLHQPQRPTTVNVAVELLSGLSLALLLKGVGAAMQHFFPENNPGLPSVQAWDSIQPLLSTALHDLISMCIVLAVLALALGAQQFCRSRRRLVALGTVVAVFALSVTLADETLASGVAKGLPLVLGALTLWALLQRGKVGVALALLALIPLTNLPRLLSLPIVDAGTHAALTCVVTLGLSWLALRYGRGRLLGI